MSSTTSNTARLSLVESGLATVQADVTGIQVAIGGIRGDLTQIGTSLEALLAHLTVPTEAVEVAEAPVQVAVQVPAKAAAFKRLSKEDFRALKVSGQVPWLMTQKEALAAGLIGQPAAQVVAQVVASAPAKAPKAPKAPVERTPEPEYGTEAWIAWARVTDDGAPRRADGSVTPKAEWLSRMALAASGQFDAKQIDAVMANI